MYIQFFPYSHRPNGSSPAGGRVEPLSPVPTLLDGELKCEIGTQSSPVVRGNGHGLRSAVSFQIERTGGGNLSYANAQY